MPFVPPAPVPGTAPHVYETFIVDDHGTPYGQVAHAVPTDMSWELDGIGDLTTTTPAVDTASAYASLQGLLPQRYIPGAREVQVWRDGVPIWWGPPVTPAEDRNQVTVQCSTLEWHFGERLFGPLTQEFLANNGFESATLSGSWAAVGCTAAIETSNVNEGSQAVRLTSSTSGANAYLNQSVTLTAPPTEATFFDLSVYYFIESMTAPAFQSMGLVAVATTGQIIPSGQAGPGIAFASLPANAPTGVWARLETGFTVPANTTATVDIRLMSPHGSILYDSSHLHDEESVGSPPAGADVATIMQLVLAYAQNVAQGKSDLNIAWASTNVPTGKVLVRVYQFSDNGVILDAFNEFPTIGVCDWAVMFDETGTQRELQIWSPARGSIKWNMVAEVDGKWFPVTDMALTVDGSKTKTTSRVLGQGSSGPNRDIGYAAFPSYLGGRVVIDAALTAGSTTVTSATANFTAADVGAGAYALAPGTLPIGTTIASVSSSTTAVLSKASNVTATGATFGVGGLILDESVSAQPDQPVSTLSASALARLQASMTSLASPVVRVPADGPTGWFGLVQPGDVVPTLINYGWGQVPGPLMRIMKIRLFPPTEEMELTLAQALGVTGAVAA